MRSTPPLSRTSKPSLSMRTTRPGIPASCFPVSRTSAIELRAFVGRPGARLWRTATDQRCNSVAGACHAISACFSRMAARMSPGCGPGRCAAPSPSPPAAPIRRSRQLLVGTIGRSTRNTVRSARRSPPSSSGSVPCRCPLSGQKIVSPVTVSRLMIAQLMADEPRCSGSKLGWYWIVPSRGAVNASFGSISVTNAITPRSLRATSTARSRLAGFSGAVSPAQSTFPPQPPRAGRAATGLWAAARPRQRYPRPRPGAASARPPRTPLAP